MSGVLRGLALVAGGALLLAGAPGCAGLASRLSPHCPVALVPSGSLPQGFALEQRTLMTTREGETRVDTAAQVDDGVLVLVGLTPMGTRGFALTQTGTSVEVDDAVGRRLGQRPRLLLDALHRSLLIRGPTPTPGDGEQRYERGDEVVREQWRGGRWVRRSFAARHAPDEPRVEIVRREPGEAGEAPGAAGAPQREVVDIRNDWCGYEARVLTLSEPAAR